MSALLAELRQLIELEGPISVERFMMICLGHPEHGYYMTRDPLGAAGDFTTAPEISQMFGELLGLFAAQSWLDLGSPAVVKLVECGPGRGTLMVDALRAAKALPAFLNSLQVELVETSPVLRDEQMRRLAAVGVRMTWHASLDDLPRDAPLILLANEFLDALPVRQYVQQRGQWHERLVGLNGESLVFGLSSEAESALQQRAPEGAVLEVGIAAIGFMRDLAMRLKMQGGVALFIDYGHAQSGFGDTLQALKAHAFVDPLTSPGEADLTAHVDFGALAKAAREAGLVVHGPVEQGGFLNALGLEARTEQLVRGASSREQAEAVRAAQQRLTETSRTGMGRLFKAVAFTAPGQPAPPGFGA